MGEQLYICSNAKECKRPSWLEWCAKPNTMINLRASGQKHYCDFNNSEVEAIPYKEEKVEETKYKPKVSNISMMTMGQKINCVDFHRACQEWLGNGYGICNDLPFDTLIRVSEKYNGIQCLIDKGFIEKVEPEIKRGDKVNIIDGSWSVFAETLKPTYGAAMRNPNIFICFSNNLPSYDGQVNDAIVEDKEGRILFINKRYLKKIS